MKTDHSLQPTCNYKFFCSLPVPNLHPVPRNKTKFPLHLSTFLYLFFLYFTAGNAKWEQTFFVRQSLWSCEIFLCLLFVFVSISKLDDKCIFDIHFIYIWNGFHLIILEAKFIQEIYIYLTLYHFPYHTKIFTKYDHALGKMSEKNLLNKVHKSKIRLSENSDIFIDNII